MEDLLALFLQRRLLLKLHKLSDEYLNYDWEIPAAQPDMEDTFWSTSEHEMLMQLRTALRNFNDQYPKNALSTTISDSETAEKLRLEVQKKRTALGNIALELAGGMRFDTDGFPLTEYTRSISLIPDLSPQWWCAVDFQNISDVSLPVECFTGNEKNVKKIVNSVLSLGNATMELSEWGYVSTKICAVCSETAKFGCKCGAGYCGLVCQKIDWKSGHGFECVK